MDMGWPLLRTLVCPEHARCSEHASADEERQGSLLLPICHIPLCHIPLLLEPTLLLFEPTLL